MNSFIEKAARKQLELSQAEEAASEPSDDERTKRDRMEQLLLEAQEQTALKRNLETELKQVMLPSKTLERQLHNLRRQQATASNELVQAKHRLQDQRDQILAQSGSAESEDAYSFAAKDRRRA
jgi:ABC-type phosphate transport system auxiliary subunit